MSITIKFMFLVFFLHLATPAEARFKLSPYISIKSSKKTSSKGEEKKVDKKEAGLRASVSFWRLFKFQVGAGQSNLITTEKTVDVADEYDEIDFKSQADLDVSSDDNDVKMTTVQRNAKVSLILDPGFSIFVARFKLGVTATQRLIDVEESGKEKVSLKPDPTYKPHSGLGLGVRLSRKIFFLMEYEFNHYKFPKFQPFEQEVSVSLSVSI